MKKFIFLAIVFGLFAFCKVGAQSFVVEVSYLPPEVDPNSTGTVSVMFFKGNSVYTIQSKPYVIGQTIYVFPQSYTNITSARGFIYLEKNTSFGKIEYHGRTEQVLYGSPGANEPIIYWWYSGFSIEDPTPPGGDD